MIVTLDESLFQGDIDDILLLSVFRLGRERHVIYTAPAYRKRAHGRVNRWLAQQSQNGKAHLPLNDDTFEFLKRPLGILLEKLALSIA